MQDWVIENDKKVVIIFEGRDAAGKGGTIKRITENLNLEVARLQHLQNHLIGKERNGIFNDMSQICQQLEK